MALRQHGCKWSENKAFKLQPSPHLRGRNPAPDARILPLVPTAPHNGVGGEEDKQAIRHDAGEVQDGLAQRADVAWVTPETTMKRIHML